LNSAHNKSGPSSDSADGRYYKRYKTSHPKARLVHDATMAFCFAAWAVSTYLQLNNRIHIGLALGIGFFGFVPYLLSVYVVEPWLNRRFMDRSGG
jgi:hypothetical protein